MRKLEKWSNEELVDEFIRAVAGPTPASRGLLNDPMAGYSGWSGRSIKAELLRRLNTQAVVAELLQQAST